MEHINVITTETLDKGQLEEKLKIAQEKRDILSNKKFEFCDKEKYDLYVSSMLRFNEDEDRKKLYITAGGFNYNDVLENYKKFESFENDHLKPVLDEIRNINGELNKINRELNLEETKKQEIELGKKFEKEKAELINNLYRRLDEIYSQIPKVAMDVGMKTDVALKEYIPGLTSKAESIEYYIQKAEKIDRDIDLLRLKDEIAHYL